MFNLNNFSLKIPTADQVSTLDQFTILNEPITSLELMERASKIFCHWFVKNFPSRENRIMVLAGPGNNGGDGLAVARLLIIEHYNINVLFLGNPDKASEDCKTNFDKFIKIFPNRIKILSTLTDLSQIGPGDFIIDALLGSGLNKPLEGNFLRVVRKVNSLPNKTISIDIPTGMFADETTVGDSIQADHVLSFEFPKLSFLMPESEERVKQWDFESIGLLKRGVDELDCNNFFLCKEAVKNAIPPRGKFSHKGVMGKVLLIAGQPGFAGAAILSGRGCLRAGAGLLYILSDESCLTPIQTALPEAIFSSMGKEFQGFNGINLSDFDAIACGPGLGQSPEATDLLLWLLNQIPSATKLVLDADALNIVASNKLLCKLPPNSILTPHPGEFSRLFGLGANDFETLEIQRQASVKYGIHIIYKGRYSRLSTPGGIAFFNPTGNCGMATAGSGDVLTGVIAALLGRGLSGENAAAAGMYIHGRAGDLATYQLGEDGILASDIAQNIPIAMKELI
ncbi:MAG: NAD(P)H-hydrate dehydratase [Saprospirales bacterium]|nr:MAG: NAD(P)H-hydrate dehydratase [Saprospirales bacterium]